MKWTSQFRQVSLAMLLASQALPVTAADLVLPQNRPSFYSDEPIEIAVAGLDKGAVSQVEIVPTDARLTAAKFSVTGDGGTVVATLAARSLAPGEYMVRLDGKDTKKLTIATGVKQSTMLVSQTMGLGTLKASGANFFLGNAFTFGTIDGTGQPLKDNMRLRASTGMQALDKAIAADYPTIVYMYWTGYVTHKPWGTEKSWGNADMMKMMRLFNLHTGQYLRRYDRNIVSVGTLDEPGLSWGKTPAGGMASGFPNWDEQPFYEQHGWHYTNDPAAGSDEDWMKYVTVRSSIMKENNAQAAKDLKTVWPSAVFSTDLYAPQANMDGTDPLNQEVNDIPSSHVFMDWGIGKAGVIGSLYLEKAHNPTSKIAHAMNGQLFAASVPQPQQRYAYHVMMNGMLAAGLHSNWWLNYGAMKAGDLKAVNEPAARLGPVFDAMTPKADVAVLWGFSEIAMRQKEMSAKEAKKQSGEQIKLMIASWPDTNELSGSNEQAVNAYSIGGNYKEQVLAAHQSLSRAGYAAHIVHERILPRGILKSYNTLVIVGQTHELPADVNKAIADFAARGGKVIVDKTTTVKIPGALVTESNFQDPAFRWGGVFGLDPKKNPKVTVKQASYYQTNYFMDEQARAAAPGMKKVMAQTAAMPVFSADVPWLVGERHVGGEGSLSMVLNAYEELPEKKDEEKYFLYNYAPYEATYTLKGIPAKSVVYVVEGLDWSKSSKLTNPAVVQTAKFEPGEMKLYLVAPREPSGLKMQAQYENGALRVTGALSNLKMPWPVHVTVKAPDGKSLFDVYRSMDSSGQYSEAFPVGFNAPAGAYAVEVQSPVAADKVQGKATVDVKQSAPAPAVAGGAVRVFDEATIRSFLAGKPEIAIAATTAQQAAAQKIDAAFKARGIKAHVIPAAEAIHKALYPRVWNPYAKLYRPAGDAKLPEGAEVKTHITLMMNKEGVMMVTDDTGKDLGMDWKKPNSIVMIEGDGFVDYLNQDKEAVYERGVQLYFDAKSRMTVMNSTGEDVQTTEEFKKQWSRPWSRLSQHFGGYQLPPQLPEAYDTSEHLILLGDSQSSEVVAALQASELLPQIVDAAYPGPGKALVQFAWSPFGLDKNAIYVGASDEAGIANGVNALIDLLPKK